jgi:hypothetical protein
MLGQKLQVADQVGQAELNDYTVVSRLPTSLAFLPVRVLTVFATSRLVSRRVVSRRVGNIAGRRLRGVSRILRRRREFKQETALSAVSF